MTSSMAMVNASVYFFTINGPFSPGGSASILSIIEIHVGYVIQLIDKIVAEQVALAPEPGRSATLLDGIRESASKTVWSTGGCTSWYLDKFGQPLVNPILLDDLADDMATPDFGDFDTIALTDEGSAARSVSRS